METKHVPVSEATGEACGSAGSANDNATPSPIPSPTPPDASNDNGADSEPSAELIAFAREIGSLLADLYLEGKLDYLLVDDKDGKE